MKKLLSLLAICSALISFAISEKEYMQKSSLELANMVKNGKTTSVELVNVAYGIIEKENPKLNAIIYIDKNSALNHAKTIDSMVKNNDIRIKNMPFAGVPTVLKGMEQLKGLGDTTGLVALSDTKPAVENGSVAKDYMKMGLVILGATSYPELGMRNVTLSHKFGISSNPFDITRNPGGSSGGSAAAISSGMVSIASGSDIGGSIRIPSSWNGLIGLKTSGSFSKFAITKTADDTKEFFLNSEKTEKLDKNLLKSKDYGNLEQIKNMKIKYILDSPMGTPVSKDAKIAVLKTVKFLKNKGFEVEEIKWPVDGRAMLRQYTYNMLVFGKKIGQLLNKKNVDINKIDPLDYAIWKFYKKYKKELVADIKKRESTPDYQNLINKLKEIHNDNTILITPTNSYIAPKNSTTNDIYDGVIEKEMVDKLLNIESDKIDYKTGLQIFFDQWEPMLKNTPFPVMFNMTKEPAISLPVYMTKNGLPLGVMLSAGEGKDQNLILFAKYLEKNHMFEMRREILSHVDKSKLLNEILNASDNKNMKKILKIAYTELNDNSVENNINNKKNQDRVDKITKKLQKSYLKTK
ncbi:amidase family protein [Oceanivirga salmonicida]|uniref:amidase family protein n=1 Tax=Oceanivirga salmonicida TaxID=1769291 RepID=UPI0018CC616B|nr:amidase family protein [Oceanivirga salmonicida]